jgi:hypothetical protein
MLTRLDEAIRALQSARGLLAECKANVSTVLLEPRLHEAHRAALAVRGFVVLVMVWCALWSRSYVDAVLFVLAICFGDLFWRFVLAICFGDARWRS